MPQDTIKDRGAEVRIVNTRVWAATGFILLLTLALVSRLFYLQVVRHNELATQSEDNRVLIQAIPPTRGLVYDVNGELLALNKPSHTLSIIREQVPDMDELLNNIAKIIPLSEGELQRFKSRIRRTRPFQPVPLKQELTFEEVAKISVNQFRLPGVNIQAELVRIYPYGSDFAHSVGYVGRINDRDLRELDESLYSGTHITGKIGLERSYESVLLGKPGTKEVEINAQGRALRVLNQTEPESGQDLHLYLDAKLQAVAIEALAGRRGAVVAMDPKTGGILVMASTPSFDPNLFVTGIDTKSFNALNTDINRPLYNRASLGEYPPASTIKPYVGMALLEEGIITDKDLIFDRGYFRLPNNDHRYRNWKRSGHGWVDLNRAIEVSNDTYFYSHAVKLGIDNLNAYGKKFGLGRRTSIDIKEERPGLLPSREWKHRLYKQLWYPGETVIAIIGQGYMLATPMQLLELASIIANRGKSVQPRLVRDNYPQVQDQFWSPEVKAPIEFQADEKHWDQITNAMVDVVHSKKGTAYWSMGRGLKYTVAGKTGTAQVVSIAQDAKYDAEKLKEFERDHSLFIAFAPAKDPQIVVSVVVENSSGAPQVARRVLDAYLLPRLEAKRGAKNGAN